MLVEVCCPGTLVIKGDELMPGMHSRQFSATLSRSRQAQRGASLLMVMGFMLLTLSSLAIVLDTGRLYLEKRKLQRLVDVVALDVANRSVLCGPTDTASIRDIAQASAVRNGYTGTLAVGQVELGKLAITAGARSFVPNSADPDAIRITATKTVPASFFGGGLTGQQISLSSSSVAERSLLAGISAGTNLLLLDSATSPLLDPLTRALFGKPINLKLDALTYRNIAHANVTLGQLLGSDGLNLLGTDLSIGAVNTALATDITLVDLIRASVDVLKVDGVTYAQLNSLHTGVKSANLALSDIISVGASDTLDAQINVIDVIMAGAYAANMGNALEIDLSKAKPGISIPGLTDLGLNVKVIEPPQIAFGKAGESSPGVPRTVANTAQLKLVARAKVTLSPIANLAIGVAVNAADGRVWLKEAQCQTLGSPYKVTLNGTTSTLTTAIGNPDYLKNNDGWKDLIDSPLWTLMQANTANIDILPLPILGPTVRVKIAGVVPRGVGASRDAQITVSDRVAELPTIPSINISSGLPGLTSSVSSTQLDINLSLLGIPLLPAGTLNSVTTTLLPLLGGLLNSLLSPVLNLIGINLNSVDVNLTTIDDSGVRISY